MYYSGGQLNGLMLAMPSLVLVLTMSGGIHLVNYYLHAARQQGVAGAARRALQVGWLPCSLAAVSTAIGAASLGSTNSAR